MHSQQVVRGCGVCEHMQSHGVAGASEDPMLHMIGGHAWYVSSLLMSSASCWQRFCIGRKEADIETLEGEHVFSAEEAPA
mmetsp:Transcript_2522/g.6481  ORF Transcript_2522/g.6481 Transcript_2522/m.6481 type:complete len:80 (+) Transcript_2522:1049-1288(+)